MGQDEMRVPVGPPRARWTRLGFVFCMALLLLSWSGPAQSQAEGETWGYGLSHELMSPFCPGRTLAACTSPQAAELRQWILLQEAAGTSREDVIFILEERFGDVIRSTPEVKGWGMAAWFLPVGVLALGAVLVFFVLRRLVGDPSSAEPGAVVQEEPPAALSAEDEALARQVDQELAARNR